MFVLRQVRIIQVISIYFIIYKRIAVNFFFLAKELLCKYSRSSTIAAGKRRYIRLRSSFASLFCNVGRSGKIPVGKSIPIGISGGSWPTGSRNSGVSICFNAIPKKALDILCHKPGCETERLVRVKCEEIRKYGRMFLRKS